MNRQMEELSQVVITLRSENEQMINTLLEKVTRLSEQITQVVRCPLCHESNLCLKFASMQGEKNRYRHKRSKATREERLYVRKKKKKNLHICT